MWLSGLSASLQTKGSPVQFPVGAHAWVAGQVPSSRRARGNHRMIFLSLSFSHPSPVSNNKINKIFKNRKKKESKRPSTDEQTNNAAPCTQDNRSAARRSEAPTPATKQMSLKRLRAARGWRRKTTHCVTAFMLDGEQANPQKESRPAAARGWGRGVCGETGDGCGASLGKLEKFQN